MLLLLLLLLFNIAADVGFRFINQLTANYKWARKKFKLKENMERCYYITFLNLNNIYLSTLKVTFDIQHKHHRSAQKSSNNSSTREDSSNLYM